MKIQDVPHHSLLCCQSALAGAACLLLRGSSKAEKHRNPVPLKVQQIIFLPDTVLPSRAPAHVLGLEVQWSLGTRLCTRKLSKQRLPRTIFRNLSKL